MKREDGFTLIEIIVSLIIVGILASVAGMGIVAGIQGYLFAKDNSAISGKGQLAMARMSRTFMEILDITDTTTTVAIPARITYNRLSAGVNIQETLYQDTSDNTIKIAAGADATGGDTLIDRVSSLTLAYRKGAATWVRGTDDFSLLSTVTVTLTVTRPDGGNNVTFSTVVTPRNNGNRGGSPSTSSSGGGTSGCFVATAAFGHPDHPTVLLLREFRDNRLLTWPGGRMVVRAYYAASPPLADLIRERGWARALTRWLLFPFVGMAFLLLHAPLAVPFTLLISWMLMALAVRTFRKKKKTTASIGQKQQGAILLGLIGTMVVFSVLGAAMLSFTNISTFNQLTSTGSARAYYLAEGGMRYAGSRFKNAADEIAKDTELESLHNHDFSLGADGLFHLDVYPYYFKTTAAVAAGATTLSAKHPGGVPLSPYSFPASGYLKIGNTDSTPRQYASFSRSGSNITFTMSTALPAYPIAINNVLPVGQASAVTLGRLGTLTLSTGASAFPPVNGTFTIGTAASTVGANPAVFAYKTRNGNSLLGVTLSNAPSDSFSVSVPANAFVTCLKFVSLSSRGAYTPLQATRTITYNVPIGWVSANGSAAGKSEFTDPFADLSHWNTGTGQLGSHQIVSNANTDSSSALSVTAYQSYGILGLGDRASLLTLNWSSTGIDLGQSWAMAGNFLSYDAQTKLKVVSQPKYVMAGLVFRVDTTGQMYGLSYLRPDRGSGFLGIDVDRIPEELCPGTPADKKPLLVLWQETSGNTLKWLAYKTLTSADGVVANTDAFNPWITVLVRVVEAASLKLQTSSAPDIEPGDDIPGGSGTAKLIRKINDADGNVVLLLNNIDGTFTRPAVVGGYTTDSAWGYRPRDNYIHAFYATTSALGTANANPLDNNRLGVARLSSSGASTWPVDDIADWAAANDSFTLVQWNDDLNLDSGDIRMGTGNELHSIIRTDRLVTASSGTFSNPELGLDTWGTHSTYVYFDDFALQTASPGYTQGFLPAIQQ
jgi:prepilin-type N-terminal cleavage/methylation domain-containing protein